MKSTLRFGLLCAGAGVALLVILYLSASLLKPDLPLHPIEYGREAIKAVEELRDVSFDHESGPVIYQEVDYREGDSAPWYPRGESPLLAELVLQGRLPPLEQRIPEEPLVLKGVEGVGKYGGTWIRVASSPSDIRTIGWRLSGSSFVRWSPLGHPIVPNVAKNWKSSPDLREWIFEVRKGIRYSDGHLFSVDDIIYWWEWEVKRLTPERIPDFMKIGSRTGEIYKIDEHTVKFVFPKPNGVFLEQLARAEGFHSPRHYLEPYHPEIGDDKLIDEAMLARQIPTRRGLYTLLKSATNPEHPRIWPWIYRTHRSSPPHTFVRNPYYWAVDEEGNQLPYIDQILFQYKPLSLLPNVASTGGLSMQARQIRFDDYTLLMSQREAFGYRVLHWFPSTGSSWAISPNLNRFVEPSDMEMRNKAELLADSSFRKALSLAIDRKSIIKADYNDLVEPAQISPGRQSYFFNEKLHTSFIEYDPGRADEMLDDLGLTRRDAEGYRTFRDGARMTWYLILTDYSGEGPAQFVVDDWGAVGIRLVQRIRSRPFFSVEKKSRDFDFMGWSGESEYFPLIKPSCFVVARPRSHGIQADGYATWYQSGGLDGVVGDDVKGAVEPPIGHPLRRGLEVYEAALQAPDRRSQKQIFEEALDIAAENLWTINIATSPPQLVVVKDEFRNVPKNVVTGANYRTPANGGLETFFFEKNRDTPGTIAKIKEEIVTVTLPPYKHSNGKAGSVASDLLGGFIRLALFCGAVFAIVLVGIRHPYIGKRLAIMAPTLLIVSVITFSVIQLPPGSYLETKMLEAEVTGDQAAIAEVEALKEMFPFDEPAYVQYLRWLGVFWFKTFDTKDAGLLQGHLGRSMETQRTVNEIVGNRVILTICISAGTILFTWCVALPIGIYSAVKQYSIGDYFFTFVGFIGMCVPNFLLAIIISFLSMKYLGLAVTGLFSPEFAAQPDWNWAKLVDLMKHIWVPVVVVGVGGMAGMMRVMRGNLLDELRKPYVISARARGVRPFKLLLKYPVRLAMNPFISGIGGIFPQLVSGGAIVAMVLSLQTVGPLMLQALMSEDMYLAGSMLMVLSLLGVLGTLFSDLLLLVLDPRIRMEGGTS